MRIIETRETAGFMQLTLVNGSNEIAGFMIVTDRTVREEFKKNGYVALEPKLIAQK